MTQDGDLYCGSQDDGLYHTKTDFSKIETKPRVISSLNLSNNFPNPFNSSTEIQYELPKDSFVSLKIYNILGQEIETLTSENKKACIYFNIWNASQYPSGVYIYKLQADNQSQVKKMVVLR